MRKIVQPLRLTSFESIFSFVESKIECIHLFLGIYLLLCTLRSCFVFLPVWFDSNARMIFSVERMSGVMSVGEHTSLLVFVYKASMFLVCRLKWWS